MREYIFCLLECSFWRSFSCALKLIWRSAEKRFFIYSHQRSAKKIAIVLFKVIKFATNEMQSLMSISPPGPTLSTALLQEINFH